MNPAAPGPDSIDQIDWQKLRVGGMPAYEQILRQLHAGYRELAERLAQHEALPHLPARSADHLTQEAPR